MTPARFDPHARDYDATLDAALHFSGESTADFARLKVDLMLGAVRRLLGDPGRLRFLDVGCGIGTAEALLASRVGHLVACDPSPNMVAEARARCPAVEVVEQPHHRLPFDDGAFDVQFCFVVWAQVSPSERPAFVAELARVVRPGGLVLVFEHNPFNPLTRHVVRNCPFDGGTVMLRSNEARTLLRNAGLRVVEQRYYYFFPRLLASLRWLEPMLGWLPLGGQYYVAAQRPLTS